MEVKIYPIRALYEAVKTAPAASAAIISTSFSVREERLPIRHITEVYDDLDREVPGRSLSSEAAERMADFIRGISPETQIVYTACDSGMCRSSAVAAAVCRYFGMNEMAIWENPAYSPNPLVYVSLCGSLGLPVTDEELDLRIETNRMAFRRAVRG